MNIAKIIEGLNPKKTLLYSPLCGVIKDWFIEGAASEEYCAISGYCKKTTAFRPWLLKEDPKWRGSNHCYFTGDGRAIINDMWPSNDAPCQLFPIAILPDWDGVEVVDGMLAVVKNNGAD